jgi:arylsulfatase A-like enzyme
VTSPSLRTFYAALISWLLLFVYLLAFYQSANTPLRAADLNELLQTGALALAMSGAIAALVWLLSVLLGSILDRDRLNTWLLRFTAGPVIFVLALMVVENWFYSLLGVGLKSGQNLWLKIGFIFLAGFITTHGLSVVAASSQWLARKGRLLAGGLVAGSLVSGAYALSAGLATHTAPFTVTRTAPLPHILLISADGLSADFMSLYGYSAPSTPFLESVADELMIYDAAYVNNANTTGSITSVLNGISPATTKVIYPPDFLSDEFASKSLPRLLGDLGYYRSQWSVPHYASAPSQGMSDAFDRVNGADQKITVRALPALPISNLSAWFLTTALNDASGVLLDALAIREMDNPYAQVAEQGESQQSAPPAKLSDEARLAGLKEDLGTALNEEKPLFAQVHLMDTHGLKFFPSVRNFSADMVQNEYWMTPFYLDSVAEFDRRLAELFAHLADVDVLDSMLVIIFSDHPQKWKTDLRVPLLIRFPDATMTGDYRHNVQLLDLAPTIIDWLGGTPPEWMQGMSLLEVDAISEDRMFITTGFNAEVRSTGDGLGWQRAETEGRPFHERNEFRIIHCSETAKTTFPELAIRFKPLPQNPSPDGCNRYSPQLRTELAIETLQQALKPPVAP